MNRKLQSRRYTQITSIRSNGSSCDAPAPGTNRSIVWQLELLAQFTRSGKSGHGPGLGASPSSFMRTGQGKRPHPSVLSVVIKAVRAKRRELFFLFCSNNRCRLQGLLALNQELAEAEVDRDLSHATATTAGPS